MRLLSTIPTLMVLLVGTASAQVTSGERKCIETINGGVRNVAKAEGKQVSTCITSFLKNKLGSQTILDCAAPANSAKVQKQFDKALAGAAESCSNNPPSFGPPSLTTFPDFAAQGAIGLARDVFGPTIGTGLANTAAGASCQTTILKAVQTCADTRIREFAACKSAGMRFGLVFDESTMQTQCLGTGADQPDPKGKIGKSCFDKVITKVESKCVGKGVGLITAFPGCAIADSTGTVECLDGIAKCNVCNTLNATDGLDRDCDEFDDGNDLNSSCAEPTLCGDLLVDGTESCEDGDTASGDGCSATCQIESGWSCAGLPAVCTPICGDGVRNGGETCDDGDTASGDGCSSTCQTEPGYSCTGTPSSCAAVCGDGDIVGGEECDDDNTANDDGCSSTCAIEFGYACNGEPSACGLFDVVITSPSHGQYTQASSLLVTGVVNELSPALAQLTVNGLSVPVQPDGTFSTTVPIDPVAIYNPIRASVVDITNDASAHDRVVAIAGTMVPDGDYSLESIALRIQDTGLDEVEPLIQELAGEGLDLADLVPVNTVLINNQCFLDSIFGCVGRGTVRVSNPPPSFASFNLEADSMINFVAGDITVTNISVDVQLSGSGLVPSCPIGIDATAAFFFGDYALSPDPILPSNIDVNQVGPLQVSFSGFNTSYGGICDVPVIGDIIQAFMPDVEDLTVGAMRDFLSDPDGAGPLDGPIADAIEVSLAGIDISGPIGSGLGVQLDTPLFEVLEDHNGITLGSDSSFTVQIGNGPGQCLPPAGAPDLPGSLDLSQPFPPFGLNTPVGALPYDFALAVSSSGFNQLLRSQTECGLLVSSITELDFGDGPIGLTAGILRLIIPRFNVYPPETPFRIDIRPTLSPIVNGEPGPSGELATLKIAQVLASIVRDDGSEEIALVGAFDVDVGLDMEFVGGGLGIVLSEPLPGDIRIAIIVNPLGANETNLENSVLPPLVALLLPDLASSLASFPLPEFFDLNLEGVEVSRNGEFLSMFANLTPAP